MSRAAFAHYVVTRFNCGLYSTAQQDKHGHPLVPERWMEERLGLFERYCLPSMANQLVQDFEWLVFFDPATPRHHLRRLPVYRRLCPRLVPLFLAPTPEGWFQRRLRQACRAYIASRWRHGLPHVITTRLDCDDALGRRAIGYIQASFAGQASQIVSLVNGYRSREAELYCVRSEGNPFLSLIERASREMATVYLRQHGEWSRLLRIESDPMWLQVVHGSNLVNELGRFDRRVSWNRLREDFPWAVDEDHSCYKDTRRLSKGPSTS
ncbi:MAG TPA: glycosyltransferase [Thermoanaerobaculia bacterium]|nr:glycosyltransferase [Thermoanaerobaculia bacterium]